MKNDESAITCFVVTNERSDVKTPFTGAMGVLGEEDPIDYR